MSSQKHIIHRQVIEVEVPSVEGAWTIQNRISDAYKYNLLQVLSDVFDSVSGPDEILRIDKLEIDLGNMNAASLEEEIAVRVREVLTEKLAQIKLKAEGQSGDNQDENATIRKRPARYTPIDFLLHFLRTGTAPWWHDREQFGTAQQVLQELIERNPQWLRSYFPKLLREQNVRKRIVSAFEFVVVQKLIAVFKPELAAAASRFLSQVWENKIGVRISKKTDTDQQDAKPSAEKKAELLSDFLSAATVRIELVEAILNTIHSGEDSVLESYFERHELVVPENGNTDFVSAVLKQFETIAGVEMKIIQIDTLVDYFDKKRIRKKTKRIRRKRTKENLKLETDPEEEALEEDEWTDELSDEPADLSGEEFSELKATEEEQEQEDELTEEKKISKRNKKKPVRKRKQADPEAADESVPEKKTKAGQELKPAAEIATKQKQEPENTADDLQVADEPEPEFLISDDDLSDFVVDNAGLVLVWPYLTHFFDALGLLENRKFIDEAAASRAVHLLQYISDNGELEYEEHDLVLNKILCGIDITEPVDMNFEITENEKEEIDGLLQAVRDNWKAIGSTSINGLRISFIRKEGSLKRTDQGWSLSIERTTVDMLIDKLPWAISIIRLPWSQQILYVEW